MLGASSPPPPAPAPTTVCSSSRNRITWPLALITASRTAFSRSSNSPRILAPATISAIARDRMRRFSRVSGTSASAMRWASPSTITVFPTPASPISAGLFFLRRDSVWITWAISSSRPITGSSSPLRAISVRSLVYCASTSVSVSASALLIVRPARNSLRVWRTWSRLIPASCSSLAVCPA